MVKEYQVIANGLPPHGINYIDKLAEALARCYPRLEAVLIFHRDKFRVLSIGNQKLALGGDEWSFQNVTNALKAYEYAISAESTRTLVVPESRLLKVIKRLYKPDVREQLKLDAATLNVDCYSLRGKKNGSAASQNGGANVQESSPAPFDNTTRSTNPALLESCPDPRKLDELLARPIRNGDDARGFFDDLFK